MVDVNTILARLQNGEDPEAIANECAKAINEAIDLDKKAKEAAKAKELKAQKEAKLDALAQTIANSLMEYIKVFAPEVADELEDETVDGDEVRKMLDSLIPTVQSFVNIAKICGEPDAPVSKPSIKAKKIDPDAALANFLHTFVD